MEPDAFDIAKCDHCRTSFALLPDGYDLQPLYDTIYSQIDVVPGYSRYSTFADNVAKSAAPLVYLAEQEVTYWGIRKALSGFTGSILEVGTGLGYLTYALNKSGFTATGVDISEVAVSAARARYGDYYVRNSLTQLASAGETFDAVVMTELIEHLPDVYGVLRECDQLLSPGGFLLITTPNRDAWAPEVVWEVEGPPVHLWWFSESSFLAMADRLAYSAEFVDLADYPAARTWSLESVAGSPCVSRFPVLGPDGRPISRAETSYRRWVVSTLDSVLEHAGLTAIARPPFVVRKHPAVLSSGEEHPCPTLCVKLSRSNVRVR